MEEHPPCLSLLCMDTVRKSLHTLVKQVLKNDLNNNTNSNSSEIVSKETSSSSSSSHELFQDHLQDGLKFPNLAKRLLFLLSQHDQLSDDLLLKVFNSTLTRLHEIEIPNARDLSSKGLRILRDHNLTRLEIHQLCRATLNELIGCLNLWTRTNLTFLSVSHCSLLDKKESCVVIGLSDLRNLQTLDISHTKFNNFGLEIIVVDLPLLEHLNISATEVKDLTPLRKCRHRLKSLSAYNLDNTCNDLVLLDLINLQYLDISNEKSMEPEHVFTSSDDLVLALLQNLHRYPNLQYLDISGQCIFHFDELFKYLDSGNHQLRFLGLLQTSFCFYPMFLESDFKNRCKITGTANLDQLLEALNTYFYRRTFILQTLCSFYDYTTETDPRRVPVDSLVPILKAMQCYQNDFDIQMAGTACLCNLIKGCKDGEVHPTWLGKVVDAVLCSIEHFPEKTPILRNSLLTLCNEIILKDATFDRFKCTKMMMNALIRHNDQQIRRMAVAISSVLAARISTEEIAYFGSNPEYMSTLLNIINNCLFDTSANNLLKCTLSALWNLTDESPSTCAMFLEKGGLDLYHRVLEEYRHNIEYENKVLGLINNIAEVPHLRYKIMDEKFISVLTQLLFSASIHVSYFAAGILCHLMSSELNEYWYLCESGTRDEVLDCIAINVLKWKQPDTEMVAYRSFGPFVSLLESFVPEVQLWAMWAINHVCTANPKCYCLKLVEENVVSHIQALVQYYATQIEIQKCKHNCAIKGMTIEDILRPHHHQRTKFPSLNNDDNDNDDDDDDNNNGDDRGGGGDGGDDDVDEDNHDGGSRVRSHHTSLSTKPMLSSFQPEYDQCTENHLTQQVTVTLHRLSHETLELIRQNFPYAIKIS